MLEIDWNSEDKISLFPGHPGLILDQQSFQTLQPGFRIRQNMKIWFLVLLTFLYDSIDDYGTLYHQKRWDKLTALTFWILICIFRWIRIRQLKCDGSKPCLQEMWQLQPINYLSRKNSLLIRYFNTNIFNQFL